MNFHIDHYTGSTTFGVLVYTYTCHPQSGYTRRVALCLCVGAHTWEFAVTW